MECDQQQNGELWDTFGELPHSTLDLQSNQIQFFSWIFKEETRNFAMTCSVARVKGPLTAGPGREGG